MFDKYMQCTFLEDKGYLSSQFTFGFEFEGFINYNDFDDFENLTQSTWHNRGVIKNGSSSLLHGRLKDDCSIEPESGKHCEYCHGSGEIETDCDICAGTGYAMPCLACNSQGGAFKHCKHCDGTGTNLFEKRCSACSGNGKTYHSCKECGGNGYLDEERFNDLPEKRQDEYYKHWRENDLATYRQRMGSSFQRGVMPKCPNCSGSGTVRDECFECGGESGYDSHQMKTFEFASPVLRVTPHDINDVIKYLHESMKLGTHTNSSCGFHIHIGFPDSTTSPYDINWTIIQLMAQRKMKLVSEFEGFSFERSYANRRRFAGFDEFYREGFIKDIKEAKDQDELYYAITKNLSAFTTHQKRDIVSQHESGTLEWRGPTGFMDEGEFEKVNRFLKHFYKTVMMLSELCNTQTLDLGDGAVIKKYDYIKALERGVTRGHVSLAHNPERRKHMRMINGKMQEASGFSKFITGNTKERITQFFKDFPFMRKIKFTKGSIAYNNRANVQNIVLSADMENQNIVYSGDEALKIKSANNISETTFSGEPTKSKLVISSTHGGFAKCIFNSVYIDLAKLYNCEVQDSKIRNSVIKYDLSKIFSSEIYGSEISGGTVINSKIMESEIKGAALHGCQLTNCAINIYHEKKEIDPLETCTFDKCTFYFKRKNYATLADLKASISKEVKNV